jgi:DNA polymerase elongation subunit (family B)
LILLIIWLLEKIEEGLEDNEKSRNAAQLLMYSFDKGSTDYNKYDGVQKTEKGFLLSYYGIMGLIYGRYFDLRTASAVTLAGQALIHATIDEIEGPISDKLLKEKLILKALKIIYGDTDSVFIALVLAILEGMDKYDVAMLVSRRINEMLAEFYKRYLTSLGVPDEWQVIEMKIEKILSPIVFPRGATTKDPKKRYYGLVVVDEGLNEKGEKDIVRTHIEKITDYKEIMPKIYDTGLETKKSNYCIFAKRLQKEVQALTCLRVKLDKIEEHILMQLDEMRTGKYDSELVLGTKLTKPLANYDVKLPHTRAAQMAIDKGAVIYPGDVVLYVYSGQDVAPVMKTETDELIIPKNINYKYYEDTQIMKPIDRMLDAVFQSLVQPTSTLSEWM